MTLPSAAPSRTDLVRRGQWLEYFTIVAGLIAGSVSLIGFGPDNVIGVLLLAAPPRSEPIRAWTSLTNYLNCRATIASLCVPEGPERLLFHDVLRRVLACELGSKALKSVTYVNSFVLDLIWGNRIIANAAPLV
jgi:hypothetical protein